MLSCSVVHDGFVFIVGRAARTYSNLEARRTAPSEWTRSIGFSTQALGAGGHETKAPFTAGKGISSGGLQDKNDKEMFHLVGKIIGDEFGNFGTLFQQTGRVDLKYNTSIREEDMHFDKQI